MLNKNTLKQQLGKTHSVSELIPWLMLWQEDTVLNKDLSLIAVWKSDEYLSDAALQARSDVLNEKFKHLAPHYVLSRYSFKTEQVMPKEGSAKAMDPLVDPMFEVLDQAYWENRSSYEIEHYWCLQSSALAQQQSKWSQCLALFRENKSIKHMLSHLYDRMKQDAQYSDWAELLKLSQLFAKECQVFNSALAAEKLQRLKNEELLGFLSKLLNFKAAKQIRLEKAYPFLDTYLASSNLSLHSDYLYLEAEEPLYARAFSIKAWPSHTHANVQAGLWQLPINFSLQQCFKPIADTEVEAYLSQLEKHFLSQTKSLASLLQEQFTQSETSLINQGSVAMADEVAQARRAWVQQEENFAYFLWNIWVYAPSLERLNQDCAHLQNYLSAQQILYLSERLHLVSSYQAQLVGAHEQSARFQLLSYANIADLCTHASIATGKVQNEDRLALSFDLRTQKQTLYRYHYHAQGVGHTLVLGPSGSGKSVWCNYMLTQFAQSSFKRAWLREPKRSNKVQALSSERGSHPKPRQIFVFDKDYSNYFCAKAQGAQHYDLAQAQTSNARFNPLVLLLHKKHHLFLSGWLLNRLELEPGSELAIRAQIQLELALKQLASMEHSMWRLSILSTLLPADLALRLSVWCEGGVWGDLFDHVQDDLAFSQWNVFECKALWDKPSVALAMFEYLFYRIEDTLDGRASLILIEECWFIQSLPLMNAKLQDWLKTLRKKNAFLILCTQSLQDLSESTLSSGIFDQIPNRCLLSHQQSEHLAPAYQSILGLSVAECERLTQTPTRAFVYILKPDHRVFVEFDLPSRVLPYLSSNAQRIHEEKRSA